MKTIFLSGSRHITKLSESVRQRISNMIQHGFDLVIGDADGADRAMQDYLAERAYPNVTVFFAGARCRNNAGQWHTLAIPVDRGLSGREVHVQKDKAMAKRADYGLVLWNGKSAGSIANVFELLRGGKRSVVYYAPEQQFHNIATIDDADRLLAKCDAGTLASIRKKAGVVPGRQAA